MQAIQLQQRGSAEYLRLADVFKPQPGPREVLVEMQAVSLNWKDILMVKGGFGIGDALSLPLVPFSDGAGVVVEVGADVDGSRVGDRVCPLFFQEWSAGPVNAGALASGLAAERYPGVASQYVRLPADGVAPYPAHLSPAEASTLPCAGVTAWNALVAQGNVKAGDVVVLQGTGGVASHALAFAKALGARTIVLSSSDDKLARARESGADEAINYRTTPQWASSVLELTQGRGADIIVDVGGAATLPQSIEAVRVGGFIAVVGVVGGLSMELQVPALMFKAIRLQGVAVGSREHFTAMCRAMEANRIRPAVDRIFAMSEASEAVAYLESAQHVGKVVLEIGGPSDA